MTEIHRSDADAERIWDELVSGSAFESQHPDPVRQTMRWLYQLTQRPPSPRAQHAVDRIVRPLFEPGGLQQALEGGVPAPYQPLSPNGALPVHRPAVHREQPASHPGIRGTFASVAVALLVLIGGGGFYLLGDRDEPDPRPIPAAGFTEPTATPASPAWEANPTPAPNELESP
jgi:hypothetical protein